MSSRPLDPESDAPAGDDDSDWVDRLSAERRRRAREWEEAFGGPGSPAKDTSFFDQDEPQPRPRRRRRRTAPPKDGGFYDQDEEPGS